MPNMEGLTQALGGMSPQQAQQATSTVIGALQNQQQMENQQQYRQRRLDLIYDKEHRLQRQAIFDQAAKVAVLNMEKQMNDLKADLTKERQKFTKSQRKLKMEKFNQLQDKAKMLKSLNQEMNIPGTDDTMKAGAAIQAGVFGDLIQENTSSIGMSFGDLPTSIQEYEYLRTNLGMEESEALKRADLVGKDLEYLMKSMEFIKMRNIPEAKKMLRKMRKARNEINEKRGDEGKDEGGSDQNDIDKTAQDSMDKAIEDSLATFQE